jgi:hypothetical protein
MPSPVAKQLSAEELAARSELVSAGHKRLDAFLHEFRSAIEPVLKKYQLEVPATDLLHHRHATGASAYAVLHFYVFAPPPATGAD